MYICICTCTVIETSHCPYSLMIYVCLVLLTAIEWCKDHFFISKVFIGQAIYVLWKHCRGPYSLVLPAYWKQPISILLAFGWLDQGSNLWYFYFEASMLTITSLRGSLLFLMPLVTEPIHAHLLHKSFHWKSNRLWGYKTFENKIIFMKWCFWTNKNILLVIDWKPKFEPILKS